MRTAEGNIKLLRNNVTGDSLVHFMLMLQKSIDIIKLTPKTAGQQHYIWPLVVSKII